MPTNVRGKMTKRQMHVTATMVPKNRDVLVDLQKKSKKVETYNPKTVALCRIRAKTRGVLVGYTGYRFRVNLVATTEQVLDHCLPGKSSCIIGPT